MHCSKCGTDNPPGNNLCLRCGNALTTVCTKCNAENPLASNFCSKCGTPFDGRVSSPASESHAPHPGERRHLTVLFCDLVGSTEIAGRLDPEEWHEVVAGYHRAATEAITHYGGYVAKYLGDGVMAHFGWPEAHENDAERAARAGLAILDEVARFNQGSTYPKVSVRIGIDSGSVVVSAGAGNETDVFGEAPNIAARVQNAAAPDTLLLTASTHRLVSGLFVVEELGAQELKGIAKPVLLYRVLRSTGVRGRLASARGLTPFVGREEELRLLISRWERARDGEGQLALVVGEAGIGKSRLVAEFRERIRDTPHIWMEGLGEQFFQNSPFHAVTEMLSEWVQIQASSNGGEILARLERALESAGLELEEAVPLVAELLQLPLGERYTAPPLAPEQKRRRLFTVLIRWVFGAARLQPAVIVVEDLHWLDPSTLELLQLLAEQGATVPLTLLYTARPEFRVQWPLRAHHTQITLNRLSARNVREMVALVAARNVLATESVDAVVERTGGVPLFVEELTRAVLESGIAQLTERAIPVTLHDSLMARLDRLGPAKEVIQIGAVIGSEFSYELVHAVHPIAELSLEAALAKLADSELLYVRGIAPEATYQFKHALIRDAAYEALLKRRRRELHQQVACAIDERFPMLKEAHPELLAHHWTEAGETERAIVEWQRAGKAAQVRNAFAEARESYQQAIALLKRLPESPERDLRELELARSILPPLMFTAGFSAPESIHLVEHAAVLAEKSGSLKQLVDLMISQGFTYAASGNLEAAGTLADRALELALREGSPLSIGDAHTLEVYARYFPGDLAGVEKHFMAALKCFEDPGLMRQPIWAVTAFGVASWSAWTLGRADVARAREARMMGLKTNQYGTVAKNFFAASLRTRLREYDQAEALAARALELSEQHQFPWIAALARTCIGNARARQRQVDEGLALIRRGIAELLDLGTSLALSSYTAYAAEALQRQGASLEALATVEQAIQQHPNQIIYRSDIFRIRGDLRLGQGHTAQAEADFREAIALAQKIDAKAYELRAIMSLARLLGARGRRDEAHTMLAEIYNWFTEGFDTADLKEAKALLVDLDSDPP